MLARKNVWGVDEPMGCDVGRFAVIAFDDLPMPDVIHLAGDPGLDLWSPEQVPVLLASGPVAPALAGVRSGAVEPESDQPLGFLADAGG